MMSCMRLFSILLLTVGLWSCEKKGTPEDVLRTYIDYRLTSDQNKETIMARLTGPLLEKVSSMNDEDFKEFLEQNDQRKRKFNIVNSNCGQTECTLTYVLSYDTIEKGQAVFSSEVRKSAQLRVVDGIWKIYDITNIKTFHQNQESIQVESTKP